MPCGCKRRFTLSDAINGGDHRHGKGRVPSLRDVRYRYEAQRERTRNPNSSQTKYLTETKTRIWKSLLRDLLNLKQNPLSSEKFNSSLFW